MSREKLAGRRDCRHFAMEHDGCRYNVCVSRFADGRLAEIFLDVGDTGTALNVMARDLALCASLALQHGCPASMLAAALERDADGKAIGPLGAALDLADSKEGRA